MYMSENDPFSTVQKALERGEGALSEHESKRLLSAFGIPVCREILCCSLEQALSAALAIGFPVVMKGCSPALIHKSEGGWVELDLRGQDDVREAYARLTSRPDSPENVLVQQMIEGPRELLLGMIKDPQFGPCVLLGLGGVMAEILDDTVFRVAPIDADDVVEMIAELRCKSVFSPFRGQKAVDLDLLARSLISLGRIGLELPAVSEIDINPMIITADGSLAAADALVVLKGDSSPT